MDVERVMYYLRGRTPDWPTFQKVMGRTLITDQAAYEAYKVWTVGGHPPPGEVRPDAEVAKRWHRELADEWPNIEDLARSLLDGANEITVGSGVLTQRTQTCWQRLGWTSDVTS